MGNNNQSNARYQSEETKPKKCEFCGEVHDNAAVMQEFTLGQRVQYVTENMDIRTGIVVDTGYAPAPTDSVIAAALLEILTGTSLVSVYMVEFDVLAGLKCMVYAWDQRLTLVGGDTNYTPNESA